MMPGANTGSGFNFGQPQTAPVQTTSKSLFGTTTGTTGGFNFGGAPGTATATGIGTGMGTGIGTGMGTGIGTGMGTGMGMGTGIGTAQPQQAAGTTSVGFGTTGTTPGGFSLGQPAATSAASTSSGFSFSSAATVVPATTTSGFSFGVAPSTTTPAPAGAAAPVAAVPGAAGGGFALAGSSIPPASTAPTTGFSFLTTPAPAVAATTATATPGIFGLAPPATSTPSLFSGGTAANVLTPAPAATTAVVAPMSSMGMGLGGAQPPSTNADANSSGSKTSGKSTKDQQLSQDLFANIAVFESRKNAENAASEENIRQNAAPFHKIGEKAKEIQKVLAELASDHLQLQANTSNLKGEVMKEAEHVEMAKRTKETPMALQGDNKAPEIFFINLVRSFEAEMMYCRTKIEEVSQCMQAASNPCETEEDIAEVLQREHDTLKELASKVYAKHSHLVELSQLLKTKAAPNEQEFFRPQTKENIKTPASSVVRSVLGGGGSGLLAFQEQQQRAKAVTLGAAPPTLPLANTTTPSMFSGGANTSGSFTIGPCFGGTGFGLGTGIGGGVNNTTTGFGAKPLFGNTTTNFGNTTTPAGLQQNTTTSPFNITSPFNTKPFGS